jgi:hypothetical protein
MENSDNITSPFVFDASYKGDEATKRAAEIIGMSDLTGWSVIDTHENLALLHYNDRVDMTKFGHIRGILVDLDNGDIIANSFGYTPTAIVDQIVPTEDNTIEFCDTDGENHVFSLTDENIHIKQVFEGVVVRVIWYNNVMYKITHKKIKPLRSRWGKSVRFLDAYNQAKGPTAEQLFDTSKPYSSTCYHFLVVDNSLLVGTRQKMTTPYIVYIEKQQVSLQRPEDEIAEGVPTFPILEKIGGTVTEPGIYKPRQLTLLMANRFLKYGYYQKFEIDDERQLPGESVIIYRKENDLITDVIKINSKSYEWRSNLRGGKHNIAFQFYSRSDMIIGNLENESSWARLQKNLILFPLYEIEEMKNLYNANKGIFWIPIDPNKKLTKELYIRKKDRMHLFWINYVLSLPINHQEKALSLLENWKTDSNNLKSWFHVLASNKTKVFTEPDYGKHVIRIINNSRRNATTSIKTGTNFSAKGDRLSYNETLSRSISSLIETERGESLYAMVREMKDNHK